MRWTLSLLAAATAAVVLAAPPVRVADPDNDTPAKLRTRFQNPLKQFALAAMNYSDANGHLPLAASADKAGKPLLSWRVALLPYVEENVLYQKFKLDEPWDSTHNAKVLADNPMPAAYKARGVTGVGEKETLFQVFSGAGSPFDGQKRTLVGFTDGTSNTILFGVAAKPVPWTKPADMAFDPKGNPADLLFRSSAGQCHVALADGSVRTLKATLPAATFRALVTPAGGEVVSLDD